MSRELQWDLKGFYDRKGETTLSSGLITNAFRYFGLERTKSVLNRILPQLAAEAKNLAPYKTGTLKGSITWFVAPDGMWGAYGSPLRYAAYREYGTIYNAADHFLEGALNILKMQNLGG